MNKTNGIRVPSHRLGLGGLPMSAWAYQTPGKYSHPLFGSVWEHRLGTRPGWYRRTKSGFVYGPYSTAPEARTAAKRNLPPCPVKSPKRIRAEIVDAAIHGLRAGLTPNRVAASLIVGGVPQNLALHCVRVAESRVTIGEGHHVA